MCEPGFRVTRHPPAPWRSCLLAGTSPCVSTTPIKVGTELIVWSDWIGEFAGQHVTEHPSGVTECRWIAELDQVLLCGSSGSEAMNAPLTRASIFVENNPRVVVGRDDPMFRHLINKIGGHDLLKRHPEHTNPDLLEYFEALDKACTTKPALCADPAEQAMRDLLVAAWADRPSFVLLAFANRGSVADDEAVSHEILHAQYFTNPTFREVVEQYWKGLPAKDRAKVRAELGTVYSAKDEELMQNELQAYALMSGAARTRFAQLVEHREPLVKLLAARGITPIVVERRREPDGM